MNDRFGRQIETVAQTIRICNIQSLKPPFLSTPDPQFAEDELSERVIIVIEIVNANYRMTSESNLSATAELMKPAEPVTKIGRLMRRAPHQDEHENRQLFDQVHLLMRQQDAN